MTTINSNIFKAYDIRGVYPDELNEETAREIGRAFVDYLGAKKIAVARDMRISSPTLATAFIEGALIQGAHVVDYGMLATDMLYYAVARENFDGGAQITASHNPMQYNGMKLVRQNVMPLSGDSGISDIRDALLTQRVPKITKRGRYNSAELTDDYIDHVLSFIDPAIIQPFNLVLDAGSGMGGLVAPRLFDRLPCKTSQLCFEIDGTFPNHQANPLLEVNRKHIVDHVRTNHADAGIAWDGDADRCFFIDGKGEFVSGNFVTALLAEMFLLQEPNSKIIYDVRASHCVKDTVAKYGGVALMNRVGHAFFKKRMREEAAIFGGEVTGHYYFRDNFFADNGFIPALLIIQLMSIKKKNLADLLVPLRDKYFLSGEINTEMSDMKTAERTIEGLATHYNDGHIYRMDGISVEYPSWHFNVRQSNTEPLLRLNLEGITREIMESKLEEMLQIINKLNSKN